MGGGYAILFLYQRAGSRTQSKGIMEGKRYADHHRKSAKGDFRDRELECCGPAAALAGSGPGGGERTAPRAAHRGGEKAGTARSGLRKKVSRVWSTYDAEDKRPQALLRRISSYLEGKCTAEQLDQLLSKTNFMSLIDEERYSNAPLAALAAWSGAVTALYDEPLLSPDLHRVQGGRPRFLRLGRRLVCGSSLGRAGTRTPAPENSVWKK